MSGKLEKAGWLRLTHPELAFIRPGVEELINLQSEGSMAKPYQVRQVRKVLTRYGLGSEE